MSDFHPVWGAWHFLGASANNCRSCGCSVGSQHAESCDRFKYHSDPVVGEWDCRFRVKLIPHDMALHKIQRMDRIKERCIAGERLSADEVEDLAALERELGAATYNARDRDRYAEQVDMGVL